jgi:peptide/nickel transport system permease protein
VSTRRYFFSKVGQALLTLAFVLAFNFFLFRGIGNPLNQLLRGARGGISPQALAQLEADLGLNLPLPQQFIHYIGQTLQGHLGYSYFYNIPVRTVIAQRIWPTLLLVGNLHHRLDADRNLDRHRQGWRRGSKFDQGMLGFTLFTYAMPEFWFGLLMIMAFSVGVGSSPRSSRRAGIRRPASSSPGLRTTSTS